MSLFFVDDSCDLDFMQIKNLGIEYFNLPFTVDGKEYKMSLDFDFAKFYSKCRKGVVLKSKNITEKSYISIFEPALKLGDDIVYVCSSDAIFNYTKLLSAKNKLLELYPERKFEILDSKNFSAGHGTVCFMLAMKYRSGATIDELVDYYYQIKDSVATYLVVDSIKEMSEFISNSSTLVGSSLNIKAITALNIDGQFKVVDKVSGKRRALMKLIQTIRQTGQNIADNLVIISSACVQSDVEFVESQLKEYFGEDLQIFKNHMSPTNVSIAGIGSIAVSFNVNKKIH